MFCVVVWSSFEDLACYFWTTGNFQIGDEIKPLDPKRVASVVRYGRLRHALRRQSTGYSLVYSQLYPFEGLQNYTSGIIHHVRLTGRLLGLLAWVEETVSSMFAWNLVDKNFRYVSLLLPNTHAVSLRFFAQKILENSIYWLVELNIATGGRFNPYLNKFMPNQKPCLNNYIPRLIIELFFMEEAYSDDAVLLGKSLKLRKDV